MREIGSEFWTRCTPSIEQEYTMRPKSIYGTQLYKVMETLSGRTALEYVVEILVRQEKSTVYMPAYCCHTMIEPFLSHGMNVKFYDIACEVDGLHRKVNELEDYDVLLLMDYFGHTDDETLEIAQRAKFNSKTVIYDATHSMYSLVDYTPYDYIYGSYRKWVDINCGFLAWKEGIEDIKITQNKENHLYADIRERLFDLKARFIAGGKVSKAEFLPLVNEAEEILEREYHHMAPDGRSTEVLRVVDAVTIINKHRSNARVLTEAVNAIDDTRVRCLQPLLNTFDTPLFVPILVTPAHRDSLRHYLIEKNIYCPVHWPMTGQHKVDGARKLFESELSLICDQRYDELDMLRIATCIREYLDIN